MSDELANRLRELAAGKSFRCWEPRHGEWMLAMRAAADRIERQADEIIRLRQDKDSSLAFLRMFAKNLADGRRNAIDRADLVERALTDEQNNVAASFDKWSNALGWGMSGHQPECWALMDAAVEELVALRDKVKVYEELRPHWAQGYSSDSIAAQTTTAALSGLWTMLGVTDQTSACSKLRELIEEVEVARAQRRAPEHFTGSCYGPFTKAEWQMLPMKLRQRWWKETDYGIVPASTSLIEECLDCLSRAGVAS